MKENIEGIPRPEYFWQPSMDPNYRGSTHGGYKDKAFKTKKERVQDLPKPAEELDSPAEELDRVDTIKEGIQIEMSAGIIIVIVNAGCK